MSDPQADGAPKRRFSSRVSYYVKARPGYPPEILEFLAQAGVLTTETVIADVGCGTGLLAEIFLKNGNTVIGVEPNPAMRAAGEQYLAAYPRFRSIDGSAEETTLQTASVDMITAGQAFHWFDVDEARREFTRILRPGGSVVLVWNSVRSDASPFMEAYHAMRAAVPEGDDGQRADDTAKPLARIDTHTTDLAPMGPAQSAGSLDIAPDTPPRPAPGARARLFGAAGCESRGFPNQQTFDWDGIQSRLLSESGAPLPGDWRYPAMMAELERAFRTHQKNGRVEFLYDTKLHCGRIGDPL